MHGMLLPTQNISDRAVLDNVRDADVSLGMRLSDLRSSQALVCFDGVCNLCNGAVQWIIQRDEKRVFRFASLQSELGREVLDSLHEDEKTLDSVLLVHKGKVFSRSDAALQICHLLGGWYALLAWARMIPRFLRDPLYDWVARNRYRWFGKREECMIPTPELRERFLDQ